ncbi:MAG: DUF2141 domain-containing protein [Alphaproteobacteria bacterium]|nr:DUF2141 domain-containing protein [Alphaproteobacteria bacterium]
MRRLWLLLLGLPAAQAGEGVTLEVRAVGFRNLDGQALVEVFAAEESWLEQGQGVARQVLPITGPDLSARFEGLPAGTYAVSVIHDANMNGELDFRWLPPGPAEGSGVSNDAPASFGPPSFKDSRFTLPAEGASIVVTLRY